MGRAPAGLAAVALAALTLGRPCLAEDAVPSRLVMAETLGGVQVKILEGGFGRLLDINLTEESPEVLDLHFHAGGVEISDAVELGAPSIETVYAFTGVGQAAVCTMRLQLDAVLAPTELPNLAYSDQPNELCESLGAVRPLAMWSDDFALAAGYRRVLVLHVSEHGDARFPFADAPEVWAHADLPSRLFDDEESLLKRVSAFTAANGDGLWALVPPEAAPLSEPMTVSFLRDGAPFVTFDVEGARDSAHMAPLPAFYLAPASLLIPLLIVAVVLGLSLALWGLVLRPREKARGRPLRAVSIGYGPHQSYRLGDGETRDVALVMMYDNGRMRIFRKARGERIAVNGNNIGSGAWITGSDKVAIGRKTFRFG